MQDKSPSSLVICQRSRLFTRPVVCKRGENNIEIDSILYAGYSARNQDWVPDAGAFCVVARATISQLSSTSPHSPYCVFANSPILDLLLAGATESHPIKRAKEQASYGGGTGASAWIGVVMLELQFSTELKGVRGNWKEVRLWLVLMAEGRVMKGRLRLLECFSTNW